LIHEINTEHTRSGWEGEEGKIVLKTFKEDDNFKKQIWTKTIEANKIDYYYAEYFQATRYGCCGSDDGHMVYRYSDGKKLMNLSSELGKVDIPNQRTKRYIGILSSQTALPMPDFDSDRTFVGLVTYVDPATLKHQQVVIRSKRLQDSSMYNIPYFVGFAFTPLLPKDSASYRGKNELSLWLADQSKDPNGFSNFTIDMTFELDDSIVVHIPVKDDKLDISSFKSDWLTLSLK
jgi:hypothetical protein